MPGYRAFHLGRPQERGAPARGGVAVYVADRLAAGAHLEQRCEGGRFGWLRIDEIVGLPAPLYIGAAYIPPSTPSLSPNAADDLLAIDKLETLAIEAAEQGALVLIAGDLNAHTATLGAPGRRSADAGRRPSARGRRVLELCDHAGLALANGSVPGATSGDFTFIGDNGCSVVDYFLLCETLTGAATSLEIERHPFPGADHAALRLRLGNLLREAAALPAAAAGGAIPTLPPIPKFIDLTPVQIADYTARMTSAEVAAALEGVQTAAAQSVGAPAEALELPALLQAFEDVLTGCLKATGARAVLVGRPAPSSARAARRLRVRNHPRLAALLREHRTARRAGDVAAIRAL
jgi:hypothetical protein